MRLAVAIEFVTKRGAHCSLACRKLRFGELQSLLTLVEDYAEPQPLGGSKRGTAQERRVGFKPLDVVGERVIIPESADDDDDE